RQPELLFEVGAFGDVFEHDDPADLHAVSRLERGDAGIHEQALLSAVTHDEGHAVERGALRRVTPGGIDAVEEHLVEHCRQRAPDRPARLEPDERPEPAVPAHDSVLEIYYDEPIAQRFNDAVAELTEPLDFVGLDAELTIEPGIFERGRRLARHGA